MDQQSLSTTPIGSPTRPNGSDPNVAHAVDQGFLPYESDYDYGDGRLRSSSFGSALKPKFSHIKSQLQAQNQLLRRLSHEPPYRAGSADNILEQHNRHPNMHYSQTLQDIVPQHYSNDSGYHTPPLRYPHISPPARINRANWPTIPSGLSRPTSAHTQPKSYQPLTIELGSHQSDEPAPQLYVAPPTYASNIPEAAKGYFCPESYGAATTAASSGPAILTSQNPFRYQTGVPQSQGYQTQRRSAPTPAEGVLSYQLQRKDRLVTSLYQLEQELEELQREQSTLVSLIDRIEIEIRRQDEVDSEVIQLRAENQRLAVGIEALVQLLPDTCLQAPNRPAPLPPTSLSPQPSGRSTPPRRSPLPARRVIRPERAASLEAPPPAPELPPRLYPRSPSHSDIPPRPYPRSPSRDTVSSSPRGSPRTPILGEMSPPTYPRSISRDSAKFSNNHSRSGSRDSTPGVSMKPDEVPDSAKWSCHVCTLLNHPLLQECEACRTKRKRYGPAPGQAISIEEAKRLGLIKISTCTHTGTCLCHAHLG